MRRPSHGRPGRTTEFQAPVAGTARRPYTAGRSCSAAVPPRQIKINSKLKARYHRLVRRFGGYRNPAAKKCAIVAVAHTLALIIWHMLATGTPYTDLGADFYIRRNDPAQEAQRLIAKLEALGHKVTLEPAA